LFNEKPKVEKVTRFPAKEQGTHLLSEEMLHGQGCQDKGDDIIVFGGNQPPLYGHFLESQVGIYAYLAFAPVAPIIKGALKTQVETVTDRRFPLVASQCHHAESGQVGYGLAEKGLGVRQIQRAVEIQILRVAGRAVKHPQGCPTLEQEPLAAPIQDGEKEMLDVVPLLSL
jgi:hypothetical protein